MDNNKNKLINLPTPAYVGGLSIQEAFAHRRSFSGGIDSRKLSEQQISNLLWAANGINRPDGYRTAPSAVGAMDIDIYILMEKVVWIYQPATHGLSWIADGDYRIAAGGGQDFVNEVPVVLLLVSDTSRFDPTIMRARETGMDLSSRVDQWAAMDAGIVSQNIGLFCAGNGLATITRAMMDQDQLRRVLKLTDRQLLLLNNAVGYPAE
ncbi:MAG: nitroreductase family protein [Tannerellaceae bacterium]|nr:nitroreductase family protein [Tannerellaceae bacterium]